ncbi:hypothetical protein SALBM135S_09581 [Streptomyces alboniger]
MRSSAEHASTPQPRAQYHVRARRRNRTAAGTPCLQAPRASRPPQAGRRQSPLPTTPRSCPRAPARRAPTVARMSARPGAAGRAPRGRDHPGSARARGLESASKPRNRSGPDAAAAECLGGVHRHHGGARARRCGCWSTDDLLKAHGQGSDARERAGQVAGAAMGMDQKAMGAEQKATGADPKAILGADPKAMGVDPMATSYSDANPFFRLFRHLGWGALVNLGDHTLATPPALIGGLSFFQRRLERAARTCRWRGRLLGGRLPRARPPHRRSGRGGQIGAGVDISVHRSPRQRRRYATTPNTAFAVADVTALPARDEDVPVAGGSFDRVLCLEAAFHLCSGLLLRVHGRGLPGAAPRRPVRPHRLHLAHGRPGGHRAARSAGAGSAVWQIDDFELLVRYLAHARETGFLVRRTLDWTRPVVTRSLRLGGSPCGGYRAGRKALCARWPGLAGSVGWHATHRRHRRPPVRGRRGALLRPRARQAGRRKTRETMNQGNDEPGKR